MLPIHLALRLARRLHAAWSARAQPPLDPEPAWRAFDAQLVEAHRARRQVRLATAKNLVLTLPGLTSQLTALLDAMARQTEQLRLEYTPPTIRVPEPCDWLAEVRQIEAEFGSVKVRWADRVLRVITEPIVLNGVALGPFAIDFGWDRVGRRSGVHCFDLVALDPNPAAGRDGVTHPHVQDDGLCPGDAAEPLAEAIDDGRLADAFLLIRSVLTTYNPQSAYVPLAGWDGVICADCGHRVDREDRFTCERCDSDLCEDCIESCAACSESRCSDCLESCDIYSARHCRGSLDATRSGRPVCRDCLATCARCSASLPTDELTADTRLCPTCHQKEDDEPNDDDPITDAPLASTSPQ